MAENTSSVSKEISQRNSSTDVIAAGSFFTGPWEDVSNFTSVIVSAYASENGIVYSEFSNDQINLLNFKSYTTVAAVSETNTTPIGDYKYYRTRFKNTGASTLTYLTLVTTYDNGDVANVDAVITDSVLPDGAATAALQSAGNNYMKDIESNQANGTQKTRLVASNGSTYLDNKVSTGNSTTTLLGSGDTFTGAWENTTAWTSASVAILGTNATSGTLYIDVRKSGSTLYNTVPFTKDDITSNPYNLPVIWNLIEGEFRVRYVNGPTAQLTEWYLETKFSSSQSDSLVSTASTSIDNNTPLTLSRSILSGQTDSGIFRNVPVTAEGHMEVAIHSPRLPFGSVHTEKLTPIFQTDGVYGINSGQATATVSGSGAATTEQSAFKISTGTTIYSQSVLQGRKRLRYRAGQGVVGRFAGLYTTPVANSYQLQGFGHAEDGVYFGYGNTNDLSDTRFGILYVKRGVREVKTLTITTGATASGNLTITLNGTAFTVPVTNASNIQRTVYEVSQFTYTGWDAFPIGATVVFLRKSSGVTAGTQTLGVAATGTVGSIVQTTAGVASTDVFYPQDEWNGDVMDGTGSEFNPSGVLLDPQKGNVFQVGIQYLGFGTLSFQIETAPTGNNADFINVHVINNPNNLTNTTFGNPSFPFTAAVYSAGSTTDLIVKTGSFAGFIEGQKVLHGNRFTYVNQLTTVGATNLQALFTVMNKRVYAGRSNQAVINLLSVTGAIKHTSPVIYYLIKGGTLAGNPNFQDLATNSCSCWDTAATTVTYTLGDQLLWTGHLGDTGELDHHFGNGEFNAEELTLQPGEWVTLAAKATTGTPSFVTGSVNSREDQ